MIITAKELIRTSAGECKAGARIDVPEAEGAALCQAGLAEDPTGTYETGERSEKPVSIKRVHKTIQAARKG